jgi:hypothetical protein
VFIAYTDAAPLGPVTPVGPDAPDGPVAPLGPVGPVGPVDPVGPDGPILLTRFHDVPSHSQELLPTVWTSFKTGEFGKSIAMLNTNQC